MNWAATKFIIDKELYNIEGLRAFATNHRNLDFPPNTKEIKASWKQLPAGSCDLTRFYTCELNGETYGLVGFHIATKDLPFWFWATFVHEDYTDGLKVQGDVPSSLKGTPFGHYRLLAEGACARARIPATTDLGAQTDWITRTGEATILGNPCIEPAPRESSCITCHAYASISVDSGNPRVFHSQPDPLSPPVGAVCPTAFSKNGTYYPLDFMWSLTNAQHKR